MDRASVSESENQKYYGHSILQRRKAPTRQKHQVSNS